jgi:hypothetical protein
MQAGSDAVYCHRRCAELGLIHKSAPSVSAAAVLDGLPDPRPQTVDAAVGVGQRGDQGRSLRARRDQASVRDCPMSKNSATIRQPRTASCAPPTPQARRRPRRKTPRVLAGTDLHTHEPRQHAAAADRLRTESNVTGTAKTAHRDRVSIEEIAWLAGRARHHPDNRGGVLPGVAAGDHHPAPRSWTSSSEEASPLCRSGSR